MFLTVFGYGFLTGAGLMFGVWLIQTVFQAIHTRKNEALRASTYLKGSLIMLVMAAIEELIFRQLFLTAVQHLGVSFVGAAILSAAIFGFTHITNGDKNVLGLCNTAVVGFVLACEFTLPHGLIRVIGIHFGWNFIQWNVLGYPLYSLQSVPFFTAPWSTLPVADRAGWIHGGGFGAEGSIFTTFFWLLWFVWHWQADLYPF